MRKARYGTNVQYFCKKQEYSFIVSYRYTKKFCKNNTKNWLTVVMCLRFSTKDTGIRKVGMGNFLTLLFSNVYFPFFLEHGKISFSKIKFEIK